MHDTDNGRDYTEDGMNGLPSRVSIADSLKSPEYRILIVSNKFLTGFDEPLLQTMYVDKRLDGLQCVQSLSRLNRVAPGKTDTLVLDFVNEPDQVQEAFQDYYQTTILAEETDPNRLYDLQTQLDGFELYDEGNPLRNSAVSFMNRVARMNCCRAFWIASLRSGGRLEMNEREEFRSIFAGVTSVSTDTSHS